MIRFIDRNTGTLQVEKVFGGRALEILYGGGLLGKLIRPLLVKLPWASALVGYWMKRPASRKKIAPFIQEYGLDVREFLPAEYRSFNDFFIRKLKPECRPIVADPDTVVCPADGRYLVYPRFDRFLVKGQEFSLGTLLQSSYLGRRYAEGAMAIARLCPIDYHRFHFPCDGRAEAPRRISGGYDSVNPLALKQRLAILSENKRMVTEIETARFGTILYVEVGATSVGSIRQTFSAAHPVHKGQEKGYFEFGGSCLVLLFEKGRIAFDADLLRASEQGIETLCRFGQSLARCKGAVSA
jgi:phosphatidylserine decarboxylase